MIYLSSSKHSRSFLIYIFIAVYILLYTNAYASLSSDETITISTNFCATKFDFIDDKIVVHALLNGKVQVNMILDTAGYTYLVPEMIPRLGLELNLDPQSDPKNQSITLKNMTIAIETLRLKNVSLDVYSSHFIDDWNREHPKVHVAGLLGIDTFKTWAIGIDFVSRTLGWWKGGKLSYKEAQAFQSVIRYPDRKEGAILILQPGNSTVLNGKTISNPPLALEAPQTIPIHTKQNFDYYFLYGKLDDIDTELLLDSGMNVVSIPMTLGKGLKPLFSKQAKAIGTDYEVEGYATILSLLTLGKLTFEYPMVANIPDAPLKPDQIIANKAILGMDVFTRSRVVMDFPGNMLYVSPYHDYNTTIQQRLKRLGIYLHFSEAHRIFLSVFPISPSNSICIKDGDELLSMNSVSPEEIENNSERLSGLITLTMRIRRIGIAKPLTFSVRLQTGALDNPTNNGATSPP